MLCNNIDYYYCFCYFYYYNCNNNNDKLFSGDNLSFVESSLGFPRFFFPSLFFLDLLKSPPLILALQPRLF